MKSIKYFEIQGNRTAVGLAFYGIAPSYFLTYIAFGFTVFKWVVTSETRKDQRSNTESFTNWLE